MQILVKRLVVAAGLLLMASGVAGAATLHVVGGELIGASGVDVGGTLYDVAFADGTCIDLLNGCDDVSDFTFQTEASAILASQALLDQVFLDGPSGNFDSEPHRTRGCLSLGGPCAAITPFDPLGVLPTHVLAVGSLNLEDPAPPTHGMPGPDQVAAASLGRFGGMEPVTDEDHYVIAVWDTPAIPEPSTALLLAIGLVGLTGARRRTG